MPLLAITYPGLKSPLKSHRTLRIFFEFLKFFLGYEPIIQKQKNIPPTQINLPEIAPLLENIPECTGPESIFYDGKINQSCKTNMPLLAITYPG